MRCKHELRGAGDKVASPFNCVFIICVIIRARAAYGVLTCPPDLFVSFAPY